MSTIVTTKIWTPRKTLIVEAAHHARRNALTSWIAIEEVIQDWQQKGINQKARDYYAGLSHQGQLRLITDVKNHLGKETANTHQQVTFITTMTFWSYSVDIFYEVKLGALYGYAYMIKEGENVIDQSANCYGSALKAGHGALNKLQEIHNEKD
jgi:hypothetical protein